MASRNFKYINILSAQIIVLLTFICLLIKLQLVISKTEEHVIHEKEKAAYLNKYLDSLTSISFEKDKIEKHIDTVQARPFNIGKKSIVDTISKMGKVIPDTTASLSRSITLPSQQGVKKKFNFSGSYNTPIVINELFSIEKIELFLVVTQYDSLYDYTEYLGVVDWRLSFIQKQKGKSADIVSVFRIREAEIENNQNVLCDFVEDKMDFSFSKAARNVKFKGTISNKGIMGNLSWVDRTYGRLLPLTVPLMLTKE